jgi:hypothetical protein
MPTPNRYPGTCHACHKPIAASEGYCESTFRYRRGRKQGNYRLWCVACFNRSDNSGEEDRCCGDRAYEDRCAAACGY